MVYCTGFFIIPKKKWQQQARNHLSFKQNTTSSWRMFWVPFPNIRRRFRSPPHWIQVPAWLDFSKRSRSPIHWEVKMIIRRIQEPFCQASLSKIKYGQLFPRIPRRQFGSMFASFRSVASWRLALETMPSQNGWRMP